jgi:transposase
MRMFIDPSDIYLHLDAVDFRKSINGLVVVVEQQLELSPLSDAMFIFSNKKRDMLKILYWDKTGFALLYKRLEKQRLKWPKDDQLSRLILSEQQLSWLLGGYDIIGHIPLKYQAVSL